tara:strand:+ start:186 stop:419 length:234 start_codon:yes stop_codon:yes gene_type:complete
MNILNKEKAVNKIVDDFAKCRIDSYWFPHSETQIEWSTHQEIYLILYQNKTWDYAVPKHLDMYVENLKDQDLKDYLS